MSAPIVAARADIHRSCKTIEVVVNVLNDYCEAATAIVAIQKKLAKALREAASTRNVSDVAVNALSASANIFEAVSDVETKFSKLADKECDGLSTEVKKWFKRLAKEERAHDARVANTNYRIKQAGQIYEKNVKRNPADAAEEHNRYINILSSLGPEVTQEKQNHAFAVSQQHTITMFSVAACMARVADAEWLRACEGVRRISPSVGPVGEWRTLCEGSWNGPIPPDLPDPDAPSTQTSPPSQSDAPQEKQYDNPERSPTTPTPMTPAPEYSSRAVTPAGPSIQSLHNSTPAEQGNEATRQPHVQPDPDDGRDRSHSVNSIASLGSFPAPPTHFPLPPVTGVRQSDRDTTTITPEPKDSPGEPPETFSTPKSSIEYGREDGLRSKPVLAPRNGDTFLDLNSPSSSPSNALTGGADTVNDEQSKAPAVVSQPTPTATPQPSSGRTSEHDPPSSQPTSPSQPTSLPTSSRRVSGPRASVSRKGDYMDDAEFGVRRAESMQPSSSQASVQSPHRSDTHRSSGSVVAAMRDKYSRSTGPASPPPKDVPRLPLSVPELANKWEYSGDGSSSPQVAPRSPTDDRQRPFGRLTESPEASRLSPAPSSSYNLHDGRTSPSREDLARRRQRLQELEELEFREQEYELRLREREIEARARQLEQDRLRLLGARGMLADAGYESDAARARADAASGSGPGPGSPARHPYASSSTQLPGPREPQRYASQQSLVQPAQQQQQQQQASPPSPLGANAPKSPTTSAHPPYCTCETCARAKRRSPVPPSPRELQPQRTPQPVLAPLTLRPDKPEKSKGWIRRLSMPVMGNAFSGDSKKGISNTTYAPGGRNSMAFAEEDGRLDVSSKNRSVTNLGRR